MTSQDKGARRRQQILNSAADLSTIKGLAGLSFTDLAADIGLTKAGVAAHFDSKEALQLAVIEHVAQSYNTALVAAASTTEPGFERLQALANAWFQHLANIDYTGGCFFAAAAQAFAGSPGAVRDAVAAQTQRLINVLEEQAKLASRLNEINPQVNTEQLVFEIHALAQEANLRRELLGDSNAFELAQTTLDHILNQAVTA